MLSLISRPTRRLAPALYTQSRMASDERSEWYGYATRIKMDPVKEAGHWPRNQEERERAARKYNLIPEDYQPYEEDEGYGDYPKLEPIGQFNRDPYDDYTDPDGFRHYGEPFQMEDDLYKWYRIDPKAHEKENYGYFRMFVICFSLPVTIGILHYLAKKHRLFVNHPWKTRQVILQANQPIYEFPHSSGSHH